MSERSKSKKSRHHTNWFDPVPLSYKYPWKDLRLPWLRNPQEGNQIAQEMKKRGNESYEKGDYYDALWKYEHCLHVLLMFPQLRHFMPAVHSNVSIVCLKLGDSGRTDLLLCSNAFPAHPIAWYGFSYQHAHQALELEPEPKIAHKAYWRRGESCKKMLSFQEMRENMEAFTSLMPHAHPYFEVIQDYVKCCQHQESPDPMIYFEAVALAVEHDLTFALPPLKEMHVKSGFTSILIKEASKHLTLSPEIMEYLLLEMEVDSSNPHFDASSLSVTQLLKKDINNVKIYEKLLYYSMPVTAEDVYTAVHQLPNNKLGLNLVKLLISNCTCEDKSVFKKAYELATKLNKTLFVEFLRDISKDSYEKLKEEGNSLFAKELFEEALGKYFQALNLCRKNKMKKEMALIRANCAQACLKLQMYSDAFTHCSECVKLDPNNHKGYYRKAEALKSLIPTSSEYGGYKDVVKDYLKCHSIQPNVEIFSQAIVLAVDNKCTQLIPKLCHDDVKSGFTTNLLKHIFSKYPLTERLLQYVVLNLPNGQLSIPAYDASFVELKVVIQKTTDKAVIGCLLYCGISVKDDDIISATLNIPDSKVDLYDLILSHFTRRDEKYYGCINYACFQALKDKKKKMVLSLMKQGAAPSCEELMEVGLLDDPYVQKYLASMLPNEDMSPSTSRDHVIFLTEKAKNNFKRKEYKTAKKYYYSALEVCDRHSLLVYAASIHANLAHLLLQTNCYVEAYEHANVSINICGTSKAYFRRAEALKCSFKSGHTPRGLTYNDRGLTYNDVIHDYKQAYCLEKEPKTLIKALLLSNECGKTELFSHECHDLPRPSRKKLLHSLLTENDCKSSLLRFLMIVIWEPNTVDCSQVKMKTLLVDKKVTDQVLLKRFLESGTPVVGSDIQDAIQCLSTNDIESFRLLASHCADSDLDKLCSEAYKAKKMSFVWYLIERGAKFSDGNMLLLGLLKSKDFEQAKVLVKNLSKESLSTLDLATLLETTNLVHDPELIEILINSGVSPNGKKSPIASVFNQQHLSTVDKIKLAAILIQCGVDCNQLCQLSSGSTTPLHVATDLALKSNGDTKLIEVVASSPSFNKSQKVTNEKGESPIHCAVKSHWKKDVSITVLSSLLELGIIDPTLKDKSGKNPAQCLPPTDPRVEMLKEAAQIFKPEGKKKKKKKHKAGKENRKGVQEDGKTVKKSPSSDMPHITQPYVKKKVDPPPPVISYDKMSLVDKISCHIKRISTKDDTYFQVVIETSPDPMPTAEHEMASDQYMATTSDLLKGIPPHSPSKKQQLQKNQPTSSPLAEEPVSKCIPSDFGYDFDDLPWEVEVTKKVIKFFKNVKKHSLTDRNSAAKVIYALAEGKRSEYLSKLVGSKGNVFEARITKAGRLLWEKAISYSSKLTGLNPTPIYTQVIRVWDIILDHDDLDRRIKKCSEEIELSYSLGYMASACRALKQTVDFVSSKSKDVRGREILEMPHRYSVQSLHSKEFGYAFVPAASTNESEYNVTTFYSFDTMTVKSMVAGTNDRRDYPFKEWPQEHEIIKIRSNMPILLLGRSGTGKTTCCLYRLWNEFKYYWNQSPETPRCKFPRRALITLVSLEEEGPDFEESIHETYSETEIDLSTPELLSPKSTLGSRSADDEKEILIEEDLHQVFVTKNYVLCDQMKKSFYNMAAAYDFMESQLSFENVPLPNSFKEFDDMAFPAFLTARQFYILLDNSLGDQSEAFFKRDSEGNLQVKITSLDYDHEDQDVLLDLEQSDSEDDDDDPIPTPVTADHQKQHSENWTEVTSLYFKEVIWPKISYQCGSKDFDPMLVWIEIQSFIKGSELAIRKGAPLNLIEYTEIGNKMAPNFSGQRGLIYKLFKRYQSYKQNVRHSKHLFDECDLILDLHKRLKKTADVPWSIHSLYIDEVQDFTQAELAIFIHCCRDPNSMFFTGDTAQSIMRGIAFRFQDLRSCFHRIHNQIPAINVPRKPLNLTINYRSHTGILKLAGSIIDLISEFFKDSIDHLPNDEGMFPGPMPLFLSSCNEKDLSLLLSTNKRECSAIEFGAHQVILVQSKEAKDQLPSILKGAIVLTIFESKGLEFDDVLLYNFFTDSLVDDKVWRVVTSYLEMQHNLSKIESEVKLPGCSLESRSKVFDPKLHKSLNAELKYLYTAVTRTKCNLWIYDSNEKARLPMLEYWHKRNVVKIVTTSSDIENYYSLASTWTPGDNFNFKKKFASNSTPEQWKTQGDNFKKKHLWEQAILCYEKAGPQHSYLVKEASAYNYIQNARQQQPQLFLNAALSFLECDEQKHSVLCLKGAALCLKNSKPPKYLQAAKLFEKLGDLVKASQSYLKAKDIDNFARIQEIRKDYDSVIKSLLGKPFMRKRDALSKVNEYEKKSYKLDPKFTTNELSFSCAKFYSERKDKRMLLEVLQYMPELEKRVKFMKEAGLHREAFDHVAHRDCREAYHLAIANGWFDEGFSIAKKENDKQMQATFIFHKAKTEYLNLEVNFTAKDVSQTIISSLKNVASFSDKLIKAEANLLLGMLLKSKSFCTTALNFFKGLKHKPGILEAFNQVCLLDEVSNQEILYYCHHAQVASSTLRTRADINIVVKQAVKLYGLQHIGKVYLCSEYGNIWMSMDILSSYKCRDASYNIDRMIRLEEDVKKAIANRYDDFVKDWLSQFDVETKLQRKFQSFTLHSQLWKERLLTRQYSSQEVSSLSMRNYLQTCLQLLELRLLKGDSTKNLIVNLLVIFSPQVSIYLPQCLNDQHVQTVRSSVRSLGCFKDWIMDSIEQQPQEKISVDRWLFIWRASCIAPPSIVNFLPSEMDKLEAKVKENLEKNSDYDPPAEYIYWKNDKCHHHIFTLWLNSCIAIREKKLPLWAARLAIIHFLGNIVENPRIFISAMNFVEILTIHCTSLLAMITHSNALQNKSTTFNLPSLYKYRVQLFSSMNCQKETSDKGLLSACVSQVSSYHNLRSLFEECRLLLTKAMNYLIGTHHRALGFSMLKFCLQKFPKSDVTSHCFILTLTLFGNLLMLRVRDIEKFEQKILSIVKKVLSKNDDIPEYVQEVYDTASSSRGFMFKPLNVFILVEKLLQSSNMGSMSKLIFKQKSGCIDFLFHQFKPSMQYATPIKPELSSISGVQSSAQLAQLDTWSQPYVPPTPPVSDNGSTVPMSPTLPAPIGRERHGLYNKYNSMADYPFTPNSPIIPPASFSTSLGLNQVSEFSLNPEAPLYIPNSERQMDTAPPGFDQKPIGSNPPAPTSASMYFPDSAFKYHEQQTSEEFVSDQANLPLEFYASSFDPNFSYTEYPLTYNFYEENFTFSDVPDEFMEPLDDETVYTLFQPVQPTVTVEEYLITENIVDYQNNICNVCGVTFRDDEQEENEEDRPFTESYNNHVTGHSHYENTIAFYRFMEVINEQFQLDSEQSLSLVEIAENMLQKCESVRSITGTEQLDHAIDNLREKVEKYHKTIAEFMDSRKWRDGINEVTRMKEVIDYHLKITKDQLNKVPDISNYQELQRKDQDLAVEDNTEIDDYSELYERNYDDAKLKGSTDHGKAITMRSLQEKEQSRSRKRAKKQT